MEMIIAGAANTSKTANFSNYDNFLPVFFLFVPEEILKPRWIEVK